MIRDVNDGAANGNGEGSYEKKTRRGSTGEGGGEMREYARRVGRQSA